MTDQAPVSEREAWLTERRRGIGASDVAALLGVDPRRGPLSVYAEKVGQFQTDETPWMRRGRRIEAVIADEYAEETGRPVENLGAFTILRSPEFPILTATLDRRVGPVAAWGGQGPLEAKAVWWGKRDEWRDQPPVEFQVQLQAQMAVTGAEWGSIAALIGGLQLVWADVARNDRFIRSMKIAIEAFWERVERRDPPPPDDTTSTRDALRALWPKDSGAKVRIPDEVLGAVAAYDHADVEIKRLQKEKDGSAAVIQAVMGEATFGFCQDGSGFQWRVEPRKGYEVEPCEPRVFRRTRSRKEKRS